MANSTPIDPRRLGQRSAGGFTPVDLKAGAANLRGTSKPKTPVPAPTPVRENRSKPRDYSGILRAEFGQDTRTRTVMRRRWGADCRWVYNRRKSQRLLILGDSGKEVLGDSLRSISRQERPTCAEHQSQRLPSRPQPPSERIVQSLVTTLVSFGQSLAKMRLPLAIGVRLSRMLLSSRG